MIVDITDRPYNFKLRFYPSSTDPPIKSLRTPVYFQIPTGNLIQISPYTLHLDYPETQHLQDWIKQLTLKCSRLAFVADKSYKSSLKNTWIWKRHPQMISCWDQDQNETEIDSLESGDSLRLIVMWTGLWNSDQHWGFRFRIVQIQRFQSSFQPMFTPVVDTNPKSIDTSKKLETTSPSAVPPFLEPYRKMSQLGVPDQAIRHKMTIDGIDPQLWPPDTSKDKNSYPPKLDRSKPPSIKNLLSDICSARLHKPLISKNPPQNPPPDKKTRKGFIAPTVKDLLSLRSKLRKIKM